MEIVLQPLVADQQSILVYGRRVGYCGTKPHMPICWLTDAPNPHGPQCKLSEEEKRAVVAHVIQEVGAIKVTSQTEGLMPDDSTDDSGDSVSE